MQESFNDDDVYAQMPVFSSKLLADRLEAEWNLEKLKKKPWFLRSMFKVFGLAYVLWSVLNMVVSLTMMICKPLLVGKIVAYFSHNRAGVINESAVTYVILLIGLLFFDTTFSHSYLFIVKSLALKMRTACSVIIYRKILKTKTNLTTTATAGQTITLITKDVATVESVMVMFQYLVIGIVKIMVMTCMIYAQIGISVFAGVVVLLVFIPLQACMGIRTIKYRLATAQNTDSRIQLIQQVLSTIRVIKMYTWETYFSKLIDNLRGKEIRNIQILTYLKLISRGLGGLNRKLALYCCIAVFVALGNPITAERAFIVVGCFAELRTVLNAFIPISFVKIADLGAALLRISKYLLQEELDAVLTMHPVEKSTEITMTNVTVNYENKTILTDINLIFKKGITLILGPIGSGKTSLLKAIMGETRTGGTIEIYGTVSYACQEPWLFPGSIRQNIVFNEAYNKERYDNVIRVCALQRDFELFCSGDQTILIDKGSNLSKGQKIRINLARAVYRSADIYLLDDCLSAVDLQVGRHIFDECIRGFLRGKVCILVSHLKEFAKDVDEIVTLRGKRTEIRRNHSFTNELGIKSQPVEEPVIEDYTARVNQNLAKVSTPLQETDERSSLLLGNHLKRTQDIYKEAREEGSVKGEVYCKYLSAGGIALFSSVIIIVVLKQAVESLSDYFVRFWVDAEEKLSWAKTQYSSNSTEYENAQKYHSSIMTQYSIVIFTSPVLITIITILFFLFARIASAKIHRQVVNKILNANMVLFDKNLAGSIVNRFSRDIGVIDEQLPFGILESIEGSLAVAAILVVISTVNSWFLIPSACFASVLYIGCRLYLPAGRNIRRIEGSTRSPVIGHMQTTFDGVTTIRASGAQQVVSDEFDNHQDVYNTAQYMHIATVEAFSFYIDIFTALYISIVVAALPFIENGIGAGKVGLAITQSFILTGYLQWCILQWSEVEIQMTSAERVLEYMKIKSENKTGLVIEHWPNKGKVEYNKVNLRYSQNGASILTDINFVIEAGSKIGIVGRTGAGKSSLVSTLFRLYDYSGIITMDGVDINTVQIEQLRSKISIIPQDPILFSGTIRSNLDPKSQYADKQLWRALEEVQLNEKIVNLELIVTENDANFSTGQKQLICIARSILQNNLILVLDEATANVDTQTDNLIQDTIRRIFTNNTIIVIAHRLHTVMECDKILVMDAGSIVEYDNPKMLLNNKNGVFYRMVNEAGLLPFENN